MAEKNRIKVGVVGCGAIAQIMHLPHIKELRDLFDLKAICDYSINLMDFIGEKYDVHEGARHIDYRTFLESDIDAVFILTEGSHAPLVMQALKAGKHVFCEKPLCFTVRGAEDIERLLETTDRIVMVGYMKRYDPGFKHALKLVEKIENPRYTHMTILHPNEKQYFDIHNVVRFDDVPNDVKEANAREQNDIVSHAVGNIEENFKHIYTDALLSSLVHNVNVIRTMFGEPVGVLSTQIWPIDSCYPTITTVLNYGKTHRIVLTWSYLSEVRDYVEELSVYSDDRRIKTKFNSPFLKNTPTIVTEEYMHEGMLINNKIEASYENAFKEELYEFYQCITASKKVITSVLDAKADIKLLQLIFATSRPKDLGGEALNLLI